MEAYNYLKRLASYARDNQNYCVNSSTIASSTFCIAGHQTVKLTQYCLCCGIKRYTDDDVIKLSNPKTKYLDVKHLISNTTINPVICMSQLCVRYLWRSIGGGWNNYDFDCLMTIKSLSEYCVLEDIVGNPS